MDCVGCGLELTGRYLLWGPQEQPFCSECSSARLCLNCEVPAVEVVQFEDHEVCARCSSALPQCNFCGEIHTKRWWSVDKYCLCEACGKKAKNFGPCRACGELDNRDRMHWCSHCDPRRVYARESERVDALLLDVMDFLEAEFSMVVKQHCKLTLIPKAKFRKHGWRSTGLYTRRGEKRNIHIEEGLPEAIFMATLAHEAVHAWQEENCPPQSDILSEGLACWIEYKSLEAQDVVDPSQWFVETLHEPYLTGLRMCQETEKRLGEWGLLRAVRQWRDFP